MVQILNFPQEQIFWGFPPAKVTRGDREGMIIFTFSQYFVSRVICYISAMLGLWVDDSDQVEYAENAHGTWSPAPGLGFRYVGAFKYTFSG